MGYKRARMLRLSIRLWATLILGAFLAFGGGCSTPTRVAAPEIAPDFSYLLREFSDQTPDYVPSGALDSVVLLYDDEKSIVGSGTVIAPDRVLTAAHVIDDMTRDERGRLKIRIDADPVIAVIEAMGAPELPHGDWAILAFDRARWTRVAPVHEAAKSVDWVPPPGSEVLLVGYAAGFFPSKSINVDEPTPSVRVRIIETDAKATAWYASGEPLHLGGMSGGAAMIWNHEAQRAELIGIFRGYAAAETTTTETLRIFGVAASINETKEPDVAFIIHRLPSMVRHPRSLDR